MVISYLKTTVRYTGEMPVVSGHGEASKLVFPAFHLSVLYGVEKLTNGIIWLNVSAIRMS